MFVNVYEVHKDDKQSLDNIISNITHHSRRDSSGLE